MTSAAGLMGRLHGRETPSASRESGAATITSKHACVSELNYPNFWHRRLANGWHGMTIMASQEEDFIDPESDGAGVTYIGSDGAAVANFGNLTFQGDTVFKDTPDVSPVPRGRK